MALRHQLKWEMIGSGAVTLLLIGLGVVGCSNAPAKSPDVTDTIRRSLDDSGLKDVKVSQDREKGIVTLDGKVDSEDAKSRAEAIARSQSAGQVVADQIVVTPPGIESDAKKINSDLDDAIGKNMDAMLLQHKMNKNVKVDVKSGVVTLNGEVRSQTARSQMETLASAVPNVKQVVNNLQVKDQKATSTTN